MSVDICLFIVEFFVPLLLLVRQLLFLLLLLLLLLLVLLLLLLLLVLLLLLLGRHLQQRRSAEYQRISCSAVATQAQKLQQELAGSAAQPAASASSIDGADAHDDLLLLKILFLQIFESTNYKKRH